jgi:hypothetical protein
VTGYLAALLLTVAVEAPLYALALRRWLGEPSRHGLAAGLLLNASSHPLAWLLLYQHAGSGLATVEAFAVAWEAALLWLWLRREPGLLAGLALVANAVSLGLGAAVLRT